MSIKALAKVQDSDQKKSQGRLEQFQFLMRRLVEMLDVVFFEVTLKKMHGCRLKLWELIPCPA